MQIKRIPIKKANASVAYLHLIRLGHFTPNKYRFYKRYGFIK